MEFHNMLAIHQIGQLHGQIFLIFALFFIEQKSACSGNRNNYIHQTSYTLGPAKILEHQCIWRVLFEKGPIPKNSDDCFPKLLQGFGHDLTC